MVSRTRLLAAVALAALLPVASTQAAVIQVYNQNNPIDGTDLPSGGWGSYLGFSVRFDDPALTTTGPLSGTLLLSELTVRHPGSNGAVPGGLPGTDTAVYLKVYTTQNATPESWVGDSIDPVNMSWGGDERNVTFTFNNLLISPDTTYYFYFSNAAGDPTDPGFTEAWASGRLRVSNNANVTYSSGGLHDPNTATRFNARDVAYDPVFVATFVPEPASLALMGLGSLLMLRRRRA